ncbi:TraR/DksA family transcriptional regulator [Kineococcus endophyticus]
MDAGEFGFCVHCRRPIPAGRLEFLPHASGCVPCLQSQRRA